MIDLLKPLLPLLIIGIAPVIIMLVISIKRTHSVIAGFSLLAFALAFVSLFYLPCNIYQQIAPLFIVDGFSLLFLGLIYLTGFVITAISYFYLKNYDGDVEEFYLILLVGVLGASVLVISNHFISFFIGLEIMTIPTYVMISYVRRRASSIEAGVKYLILASVSTAFLLFGMALVYAASGALSFGGFIIFFQTQPITPLIMVGFAMILVGIGFKLAVAPFHMWSPDVYQGAPSPVTSFIATISKGAVLAVFIRFFFGIRGFENQHLILFITLASIVTMFVGNLLAIRQQNLKRLLAYSSIANIGYLLITLLTGSSAGINAAIFYLVAYFITVITIFGIISFLSNFDKDKELISDYRGLFKERPYLAIILTVALLSLGGIPFTAGFMSKFYLVLAGAKSTLWLLIISLVVNSVIGLYYYLKVIATLFSQASDREFKKVPLAGMLLLTALLIMILWLGMFPGGLLDIIGFVAK